MSKVEQKELKRVFHLSGGLSSAMMTIEFYKPGDLVIFCDTEREHPKTYKFLNDLEAHENIPIIRLTLAGGWKGMLHKMKGIPNRVKRRCTLEMKIRTARRHLRFIGLKRYIQFIGFRLDELERRKKYKNHWVKVTTIFPLTTLQATKEDVNNYWSKKEYGLEIPAILGNCDLCFMKGEEKVIAILTNDISLADKWIEDEEDVQNNPNRHTYFSTVTMRQLRDTARAFINEGKVFDLNQMTPKFNCSCHS